MKLIDIDRQVGKELTDREEQKLRQAVAERKLKDECGDAIGDFDEFLDITGSFCCDESTYLDALGILGAER